MQVKHIIGFEPGVAVAAVMDENYHKKNEFRFIDWPVTHIAIMRDLFQGDESAEAVWGSEDGKNYRMIFGLTINGHKGDIRDLHGLDTEDEISAVIDKWTEVEQ